jgi:hypothetical protein
LENAARFNMFLKITYFYEFKPSKTHILGESLFYEGFYEMSSQILLPILNFLNLIKKLTLSPEILRGFSKIFSLSKKFTMCGKNPGVKKANFLSFGPNFTYCGTILLVNQKIYSLQVQFTCLAPGFFLAKQKICMKSRKLTIKYKNLLPIQKTRDVQQISSSKNANPESAADFFRPAAELSVIKINVRKKIKFEENKHENYPQIH